MEQIKKVVDMSQNNKPNRVKPFIYVFEGIKTRYVKIHMISNSSNPAVHIRETEVFKED